VRCTPILLGEMTMSEEMNEINWPSFARSPEGRNTGIYARGHREYNPALCPVCFAPKTICWRTGEEPEEEERNTP